MKKNNGVGKNLLEKVNKVVLHEEFEEFHSFEALFQFLVKSWDETEIILLRASSGNDLVDFRRIRGLMRDVQILLVMPDRKPETLVQGHLLHPRYITYEDGNFDDLAAVLQKMLNRKRPQQQLHISS
jgi:hypothetical protein